MDSADVRNEAIALSSDVATTIVELLHQLADQCRLHNNSASHITPEALIHRAQAMRNQLLDLIGERHLKTR